MYSHSTIRLFILLVIAFMIRPGCSTIRAQGGSDSIKAESSDSTGVYCHCFLARPKPRCSSFWIIESSLLFRQSGHNVREGKEKFLITGNLGYMANLDTTNTIGGSIFVSGDDDSGKFGLCFRYRKWLGRRMSLDVSPGIILLSSDNYLDSKPPGFIMTVSLGKPNWFLATVHWEVLKVSGEYWTSGYQLKHAEGTQSALYMGITSSHWWALAWPVVMIVLVGATWE